MRRRPQWLGLVLGLAVGYGILTLLQVWIDNSRESILASARIGPRERLVELGSTVMLGSFRSAAVAFLWYQESILKERRAHAELDGVYQLIASVQPTDIDAYSFQVWNMAYNVQYDAANIVEAWKWVKRAVAFGEKGVKRNPNHPLLWQLCFQMGWVYSHRCAGVPGRRTDYFGQRVLKERGKHTLLVAADWYEQMWDAVLRLTPAQLERVRPNVHRLSMWAYAYASLAKVVEKQGNSADALAYREKAIAIHRLIADKFPDKYATHAQRVVAELNALIALHRADQTADEHHRRREFQEEIELRRGIAKTWSALMSRNPNMEEAQRGVDVAADKLEAAARSITDPELAATVAVQILMTRFHAAHPARRSAEATKALETALAPHDKQLAAISSKTELRKKLPLVQLVADGWTRVVANSPGNLERARRAEVPILRFDGLAQSLPERQRAPLVDQAAEQCRILITSSPIDSPMARRRVLAGALRRQEELANLLVTFRNHFKPPRPLMINFSELLRREDRTFESTVRLWAALLNRNSLYAKEAPVAEQKLRVLAEALEETAAAITAATGIQDTTFKAQVRHVWRTLYEYNPSNSGYLIKSRPAKEVPRPRQPHSH